MKTIIADGLDSKAIESIKEITNLHSKTKLSRMELLNEIIDTEILVIRSATQVDQELLSHAKKLKLVIRAGEGTDNIDKAECEKRSVQYRNTPGANNNSAAEHAIALIFDSLRKVSRASAQMKAGIWDKNTNVGYELAEKKVGVVGLGKIGKIVAKRLKAFDCDISYYDPFVEESSYTRVSSIEKLISESDIVSIHLPLIESTRSIFNKELLLKIKKGAILINASRGGIVDEASLKEVLQAGHLSHAALDVFEEEPLKNNIFKDLDNITLTPHLGASTHEAQDRVGEMVAQIIKSFIS